MKLTKQTLKRIIKEELDAVLNEVRIDNRDLHDLGMSQVNIDKIHKAIESGRKEDINQAQELINTFAEMMGETGYEYYARNYAPSREVGDLEKLGNQAANASFADNMRLAAAAKDLANKKADETYDDLITGEPGFPDKPIPKWKIQKAQLDRFYSTRSDAQIAKDHGISALFRESDKKT